MKTVDSRELLAVYARDGSEAAFREIVVRYLNLVYSSAVRLLCGNSQLAEEVAQMVFIDLARKARGLSSRVMLGGWLHRRTCHVAATLLRAERRRKNRERQAMEISNQQDHTEGNLARVAPILDEALNQLSAADRAAIILRFFEQRNFRSVGEALHSTEDAARMRVTRALDKLHTHLGRRGVTLAATALAAGLAAEAATAAPAGLADTIAGTALAAAASVGGVSANLIKVLTMMKTKASIVGGVTLVAIAMLLVSQRLAQSHLAVVQLRQENDFLRDQVGRAESLARREAPVSDAAAELDRLRAAQGELPRLRDEASRLRAKLRAASAGSDAAAESDVKNSGRTNVISGFTRLHASAQSRLASGQRVVLGGWRGHPGFRVFLSVVPRISGEEPGQVSVSFRAMELPEQFLAGSGLDGMLAAGTSSALSAVPSEEQAKALEETLGKTMEEVDKAGNQAAAPGKYMHYFGAGSSCPKYAHSGDTTFSVPRGQTSAINCLLMSYENGGFTHSEFPLKLGDELTMDFDGKSFDLGACDGPLLSVTPIVLGDGNSLDLAVDATIFWHFGDTP
jgi:RNA polymerase sigma factor (sigma-70 family)